MTTGANNTNETDVTAPEDAPAAVLSGFAPLPAKASELAKGTGLTVLTKRSDFVRASHALRAGTKGLNLQGRVRAGHEVQTAGAGIRVGFTCSKKVGNAVARNRAKRRLREIARRVLPIAGRQGWDYVIVGKNHATAERPFEALQDDLRAALARAHAQAPELPAKDAL